MKPTPHITPYTHSTDERTNTSISLLRLYKRLRRINATYKPDSLYRQRMKNKRALRLATLHIVR